ncbi:hypothetical protein WR25_04665 [Diploscapter pachys]|uniref:Uncharacterized protein n=1 Tax=Diploscapter pachys TaxID=2018661 RepID=A0A2A2L0V2_9BILA|nr:hypothetical protein WR25_04665 [Diploscapter pachys]
MDDGIKGRRMKKSERGLDNELERKGSKGLSRPPRCLIVGVGGERLRGLSGDSAIAPDERSHHTSRSLDTERQRSDVEQEQVLDDLGLISGHDGGPHDSSIDDSLIRIDGLVQFLAREQVRQQLLHPRDTSRATDEDDFVDLN